MKPDRSDNLEDQLSAYLDGEVTDAERADVEAYLAANEQARRTLAELRRNAELLRALPRAKAPDGLLELISAQMERQELLGGESLPSSGVGPPVRGVGRWLASAAVILMAASAGYLTFTHLRKTPSGATPGPVGPIVDARGRTARAPAREVVDEKARESAVPEAAPRGFSGKDKARPAVGVAGGVAEEREPPGRRNAKPGTVAPGPLAAAPSGDAKGDLAEKALALGAKSRPSEVFGGVAVQPDAPPVPNATAGPATIARARESGKVDVIEKKLAAKPSDETAFALREAKHKGSGDGSFATSRLAKAAAKGGYVERRASEEAEAFQQQQQQQQHQRLVAPFPVRRGGAPGYHAKGGRPQAGGAFEIQLTYANVAARDAAADTILKSLRGASPAQQGAAGGTATQIAGERQEGTQSAGHHLGTDRPNGYFLREGVATTRAPAEGSRRGAPTGGQTFGDGVSLAATSGARVVMLSDAATKEVIVEGPPEAMQTALQILRNVRVGAAPVTMLVNGEAAANWAGVQARGREYFEQRQVVGTESRALPQQAVAAAAVREPDGAQPIERVAAEGRPPSTPPVLQPPVQPPALGRSSQGSLPGAGGPIDPGTGDARVPAYRDSAAGPAAAARPAAASSPPRQRPVSPQEPRKPAATSAPSAAANAPLRLAPPAPAARAVATRPAHAVPQMPAEIQQEGEGPFSQLKIRFVASATGDIPANPRGALRQQATSNPAK
jgi:hypothetical protein